MFGYEALISPHVKMASNDIDIQKSLELDSDNSTNIADTKSEEEEDVSSPKRRRTESPTNKFAGAFKYKTKFQKTWTKTWPFIAGIPGDPHNVTCDVCDKKINIAHQGAADICSHIKSKKHNQLAKASATQKKLSFPLSNPFGSKVRLITINTIDRIKNNR